MPDLPMTIRCLVCQATQFKMVYRSTASSAVVSDQSFYTPTYNKAMLHGEISQCLNCGLLFVSDQPDQTSYQKVYSDMQDPDYLLEEAGYAASFGHVLSEIEPFKNRFSRMLEVGAGAGLFLKAALKKGWVVQGIELSKWMSDQAQKMLGSNVVFQGGYDRPLPTHEKFNVVVALHLIEHVPDPMDFLLKMKGHLAEDGILYMVTPDIGSMIAKILKERWWYIQIPHIFYFDRKTISMLLDRAGFEIISIKNFPRFVSRSILQKRIDFFPPFLRPLMKVAFWPLLCFDWSMKFDTRDQLAVIAKRKNPS